MDVSCAFAPGTSTPDHIVRAEALGYRRAWCYDTPAVHADVWSTLAARPDRTARIGLGPAVLVPGVRHVMVNAAAIASLAAVAPGRVAVGIGTGSTGRSALGRRPMPWADAAAYVRALRGLLRGEDVGWDDTVLRMTHPAGTAAARPVDVPILIAAEGPKGLQIAHELGDGVFAVAGPKPGFAWSALLQFGTVLDDGEAPDSPRVLAAAGPAAAAAYAGVYEFSPDVLEGLADGAGWRARIESEPERTRHLTLHEGHMVHVNERDRDRVTGDMVSTWTFTGTADHLRGRLADIEAGGATEVVFGVGGPDVERELQAFAEMAGVAPST